VSAPTIDELDHFRQEAGLSHGELWLRYFELGGMSTGLQLEAFLYGMASPTDHDHDVIAHALNERFVELGMNHPVAYSKAVGEDASPLSQAPSRWFRTVGNLTRSVGSTSGSAHKAVGASKKEPDPEDEIQERDL
jgi:hypothetical protein